MEEPLLTFNSEKLVTDYIASNHLVKYERGILNDEILPAIRKRNQNKLTWFNQFGKSLRHITMNTNAHRKHLEFGFTGVAFDKHGWFVRSEFLDREDFIAGNAHVNGEYSIIYLGRGLNNIWTYSLSYNYGLCGGGSNISVYDPQFSSRELALQTALCELKKMMVDKIGHWDTTNYKQPIIAATIKSIEAHQLSMVQLTLF